MLEEIFFDHLPCFSSPELDLYLEPSLISGLCNSGQVKDRFQVTSDTTNCRNVSPDFLSIYELKELEYIEKHNEFPNRFMNQLISLMCDCVGCSLIELCCKLSSPPLFTLSYLQRMEVKGLIRLSATPRLR